MRCLPRLILGLILSFSLTVFPVQNAHAGMIATGDVVAEIHQGPAHRSVGAFMARPDVQKELIRLGLDPAEADRRIAALSDEEAQDLARQIEQSHAGGSVAGVLVIVVLVLLVIYLAKRI